MDDTSKGGGNNHAKILWNFHVRTDKTVANQPDIVVADKQEKKDVVVNVAAPSDDNIRRKEHEKL